MINIRRFLTIAALCIAFPVYAVAQDAAATTSATPVKRPAKIITQQAQEFAIIARNFEYLPRRIILRRDIPARIYFTSIDRAHDVRISGLNIRKRVIKGEVTTLNFITGEAGIYEYVCDIYCGPGHKAMKGEIVVVDSPEEKREEGK